MFDVHCHLYDEAFSDDIASVIERARCAGVLGCVVVAESHADFHRIRRLAESFPDFVAPSLGLHPVQLVPGADGWSLSRSVSPDDLQSALIDIERFHTEFLGGMAAVGEVGLDFTPYVTGDGGDQVKAAQRQVFIDQIRLANRLGLPVNCHSRSAGRPVVSLLAEHRPTAGALLHAFDGKPAVALAAVRAGWFLSVPPSIVRSEQKQRLVGQLPLEALLLESDAPALGPERQARNEPANIELSARTIAQIKQVDVETVRSVTTENALKLFPVLKRFMK